MIQQMFSTSFNSINPVTWSLEIEIQFYLFVGIFMYYFNLRRIENRERILIVGFLLAVVLSCILRQNYLGRNLFLYLDFFFLGFILKICYTRYTEYFKRSKAIYDVILIISFPILYWAKGSTEYSHLIVLFIYGLLFVAVFKVRFFHSLIGNSVLCLFGKMSYSFYLVHYAIIEGYFLFIHKFLHLPLVLSCCLVFLISVLVSFASFRLIEMNKLLKV